MMRGNKFVKLVIVVFVLLTAGTAINSLVSRGENRSYEQVVSNVQNSWLHGEDIYFFTGTFFAKYNLESHEIARLSDYLLINNGISSPSWSPDSIIFQTNPSADDRDDITTAAERYSLSPTLPHWWRYSFQNKQYELLHFSNIDVCSSLIQVNLNQLSCLAPGQDNITTTEVRLLNISNRSSIKLTDSPDNLSDLKSDGKKIFYVKTALDGRQSLESIDIVSRQKTEIHKSNGAVSSYLITGGGSVVMAETPDIKTNNNEGSHDEVAGKTAQNIVLVEGEQKTIEKLSSTPISFFSDGQNSILFSALDGSIKSINYQGINTVNKATKKPLAVGSFLFKHGERIFVLDQHNNLLSWPSIGQSTDYKSPSKFKNENNDENGNSYVDIQLNGVHDAAIYLNDMDSSQQQQAVGENLEKQGFRPAEFNFNWIVDGPDFVVPINPRVLLIN